LNYP